MEMNDVYCLSKWTKYALNLLFKFLEKITL